MAQTAAGTSAPKQPASSSKGQSHQKRTKKQKESSSKGREAQGAKAKSKGASLEERVVGVVNHLAGDMGALQEDDRATVERLDVLSSYHDSLQGRHKKDVAKRDQTEEYLSNLTQAVNEMKEQDRADVEELGQSKDQLNSDVGAATSDLEILLKDRQDLNDYISEKSGETYDSVKSNHQKKQKAIRAFLLNTLQVSDSNNVGIYKENEVLRKKAITLREKVKQKFLNNDGISDEEITALCQDYDDLLDKHASIFKQLDEEANANVDEFNKHVELWKRLFTEGMNLERQCDDIDYDLEDLTDQANRLQKMKGDLDHSYGDYVGKIRYVTEQQKGIIDEIRNDISTTKSDINNLRREHDNAEAQLAVESKPYARGRFTKNDNVLETATNDYISVHGDRRRVQEGAEGTYDDWLAANKDLIGKGYADYEVGQRDRGTIMRIQDIMEQINQSNHEIEGLLADMQRIDREKGINTHRGVVSTDMSSDISDLRTRLDEQLSKRERIIVELKDYYALHISKVDIYGRQKEDIDLLERDIEDLRVFLREKYTNEEQELEDLYHEIEEHKERLRVVINEINEIRILIIEEEHHNDIKRNLLRNRDEYIERLKIAIGDASKKPKPVQNVVYMVTPGDDIDAILAEKMRDFGISIPLTRLGGGFYLFGTRKIFAKIMNGKLVVRVGGGYMIIDEFLATYSDMELIRINKMMENEDVDVYEELKVYKKYKDENPEAFKGVNAKKRTLIRSPKSKMTPQERGKF